ncbi:ciliogenesis and planar polarity effector 2-like isoform X3 [Panulirus ornatus]|uniref:ciliogenesis and planar polarity effector 2-like isoform X3 n=1 Tax=Panulirus ornatus TaxID=150431 RepID=UPI003A87589D
MVDPYDYVITKMAPEWTIGESKTYQQKLLVPGTNKRKLFGILEKPNLPPSAPNVTYKLFMLGKASSGKTWTMNRLSGQEACREGVDAVLLCFSVTDRESWTDLPRLLTSASQPADRAAIIVVATRCDQFSHREVTEGEMESFEAAQGVPILKLGGTGDDQSDELTHTAPILNFLCKRLWQRDQELLSIKQ